MATLDYVSIPSAALRLDGATIRPTKRILTSLPSSSSASIPTTTTLSTPTSGTFAILPQLLLSGSLPPGSIPSSTSTGHDIGKDGHGTKLLTTRDALSIPTTSTNFKRFVARAGPIFWLQDRIEEVVMWRRGWRVTGVWMAAYAFFCYFPRLILLVPHIALIGTILATYPYSPDSNSATQASDSSVNWQANLQAIQNLMGFMQVPTLPLLSPLANPNPSADAYDFIQPRTRHLILSPSHFPSFRPIPSPPSRARSPSLSPSIASHPTSPYPPYILTLLVLTLPPLLFLLSSPLFPIRLLCLLSGLAPLAFTHPWVRPLHPYLGPILEGAANYTIRKLVHVQRLVQTSWARWVLGQTPTQVWLGTNTRDSKGVMFVPLRTRLERVMDDDKLSDRCWRAEMREVELWENERFVGGIPAEEMHIPPSGSADSHSYTRQRTTSTTSAASTSRSASPGVNLNIHVPAPAPVPGASATGWSKTHLRPGERGPWTRKRDGWGGVGAEVSNLTFSLAQGWAFVPSEGWRKDRGASWAFGHAAVHSDVGACSDGWVYTNDVWSDARAGPYSGSVTRRRRWVRRVWFDGSAEGGRVVW